jgi:hypothetical protein
LAIVRAKVPEAGAELAQQLTHFVGALRTEPVVGGADGIGAFSRLPGIAETVEWAKALVALDARTLTPELLSHTAGLLFKQREDLAALTPERCQQLCEPATPTD